MIAFYNYGNKNKIVFPKVVNPILFPFSPWPPKIITDTGEMFWERHDDIKPGQRLDTWRKRKANWRKRRAKEISKRISIFRNF